jgi:hypothetical protein
MEWGGLRVLLGCTTLSGDVDDNGREGVGLGRGVSLRRTRRGLRTSG